MFHAADDNPYRAGSSPSWNEQRCQPIAVASYKILSWIMAACLLLMATGRVLPGTDAAWQAGMFGLAVALLVFATWQPLFAGPEEKELHRKWRDLPKLDDQTFYRAFYAESEMPRELVIKVRQELVAALDLSLAAHPADDLGAAYPEIDFADVFFRFDRVFGIKIPWRSQAAEELGFDGSFDSLLRLVHRLRMAGDKPTELVARPQDAAVRSDDSP